VVSNPVATSPARAVMSGPAKARLALRVVGAVLLLTIASIHLDLYLTGYSTIPTIGWLFLLQLISAFGLGLAVQFHGGRLVAAAAGGFVISTLAGYLLALRISLFGFREVRTTAGIVAGVIEVVAFAVLAAYVLTPLDQSGPATAVGGRGRGFDRLRSSVLAGRWAAGAFAALVAVVLGLSIAATAPKSTSTGSSGALLKVATVHGVAVLTNGRGYTLYWFSRDTANSSACNGPCNAYWPPVLGKRTTGPGVTGQVGTIRRSDGKLQATFDHHPLYTYVGDSAPRQNNGNGIHLSGGLWREVSATG
jgi:predicted lipoprotein with Yx(FWY)xxD motif